MRILIINGPNLNMLGIRERNIYGQKDLNTINENLKQTARERGVELEFYQSNHEGDLIDEIQRAYHRVDFIIINPGAFTHYSIAIYDAFKAVKIPFIEVHISNIYAREEFRQHSLLSPLAVGGIFGLGANGYQLALDAAINILDNQQQGEES